MADLNEAEGVELLDRRTRTVRLVLFAYIGLSLADILMVLGEIAGLIDTTAPALSPLDWIASLVYLSYVVVLIAAVVLISRWIYRAHANLRAADVPGLQFTPGWAVGWYFIPIANLFKPFQAMRELWSGSLAQNDSYGQEADSRLTTWWGAWIIGNIVSNTGTRIGLLAGADAWITGKVLDIASSAILIVASWFLLQIVETVSAAQRGGATMAHAFA
jgi:hypothetical protein